MSLTDAEKQARAAAQQRKSGQGFGGPRPQQATAAQEGSAIVPAARVEGANALALSLQQSMGEFGQLVEGFEGASDQAAEQISEWMVGALNGERFASKVLARTAQKLEQRPELVIEPLPAFEPPKSTGLELFRAHYARLNPTPAPKAIEGVNGDSVEG